MEKRSKNRNTGDFRLKNGIIGFGSPVLTKKATKVTEFDQNLAETLKVMKLAMESAQGVGLAAPQIGIDLAIFVWDLKGVSGEICNPTLQYRSTSVLHGEEGCLSAPGVTLEIPRGASVRLSGQDRDGEEVVLDADGYLARIFQHETDHLGGFCIAERLRRADRRLLEKRLRKVA